MPVHGFALILLALASFNFIHGLTNLPLHQQRYQALLPGIVWDRDWTIVATSALFTIELIPVALVWLLASRFARSFVLVMLAFGIASLFLGGGDIGGAKIVASAMRAFAVSLLFTRAAAPWFERREFANATPG